MSGPAPVGGREPFGRRLLRAAVIPAAFTVVAILLLVFTPSGQQWTHWLDDQFRVEETRGRIVDATTGRGVAGATVVVHSLTEKWKPSIVGEISHGVATSDDDGRFVVRYQRLASSRISARAPGYATIFRVKLGPGDVELPTSPAATAGEVIHRGEVGFDLADSTPVYFDLERDTVVADAAAADFAFSADPAGDGRVSVRALGQAGLVLDREPTIAANEIDPLAAWCAAPDSGYAVLMTLGSGTYRQNFAAFARLHRGDRFGRVRVRVYGRGPTPKEGYRVELERWLNTTGGRNVCVVPLEGEENEFAPSKAPR